MCTSALSQTTGNFYPRPPRGGRPCRSLSACSTSSISIHALREEGDLAQGRSINDFVAFLSTPSARRATLSTWGAEERPHHFYPRPPRGGRLQHSGPSDCAGNISIHALREEGDEQVQRYIDVGKKFLSTPSARRATPVPLYGITPPVYFYPRPPRGGRRPRLASSIPGISFLSTPSARRATSIII